MLYKGLVNHPQERQRITYPWVYWDGRFSNVELNQIVAYCRAEIEPRVAETYGGVDANVRVSSVSFHGRIEATDWIFKNLNDVLSQINTRWYGFDLNGYHAFQYTEYYAQSGGKYDWHTDMHLGGGVIPEDMIGETRKLSMSLLLNEPGVDFEGGELQFQVGTVPDTPDTPKGRIIAFPSFMLHRVAPLTRGVRRSLVVWVTGPKFT